ncbi:unnamed protein product [Camellia sinensis]
MDLKNSNEFSAEEEASSTPQGGQMHNFMSMPSYSLPRNLPPHQVFLQPNFICRITWDYGGDME